jgi:hypothetical protein
VARFGERPSVKAGFTSEVVTSEVFRSAILSSEVVTGGVVVGAVGCVGAVVAGQVGFFLGDVGWFGAGWRLTGKIGGAEFLATHAHYWASSL